MTEASTLTLLLWLRLTVQYGIIYLGWRYRSYRVMLLGAILFVRVGSENFIGGQDLIKGLTQFGGGLAVLLTLRALLQGRR